MATDFFDHQDQARRHTTRLVVLFVLAVVAIVATLYALAVVVLGFQGQDPYTGEPRFVLHWTNPELLSQVVAAALLVVGGGSLFKIAQLRAGGRVVAESLGGRLLHADSEDPVERRVLNVVEEMALASGAPTPPVYLLDREQGINAFAAGFTPSDAVIGVTRGCATQLSRDEFQGVIGHEFSHILNGDMRLNLRLMGVLHGILLIGIIGYFVLRSALFSGGMRGRSRDNSGAIMLAVGGGLMAVGFLGTFFGNWIKASVSRQREYLADASSVQFTRNPGGIAGALKKIGALAQGSTLETPAAAEASHLLFGRGLSSGINAIFSTHPPLDERIRRLDPNWDGQLGYGGSAGPARASGAASSSGSPATAPLAAGLAGTPAAGRGAASRATEHIGRPSPAHVEHASKLIERLPGALRSAARESYGARALVYALLLSDDEAVREAQLQELDGAADPGVLRETRGLWPLVRDLDPGLQLPLIDLTLPALRELGTSQYPVFRKNVEALVRADERISLFEWTLQRILMQHLRPHFEPVRPARPRYSSLRTVADPLSVVLSTIARATSGGEAVARRVFAQVADALGLAERDLRPRAECGLAQLDAAYSVLVEATPGVKRRIVQACAALVEADGEVNLAEVELLRATADTLGCPMPPLLPSR